MRPLNLFLEIELGQDMRPINLPEKTDEDILLFFKLYDHEKEEVRYVGRLIVKRDSKPTEILSTLNRMAGFESHQEIELTEERYKPATEDGTKYVGTFESLDKQESFLLSKVEDGAIIWFRKSPVTDGEEEKEDEFPDVVAGFIGQMQIEKDSKKRKAADNEGSQEVESVPVLLHEVNWEPTL